MVALPELRAFMLVRAVAARPSACTSTADIAAPAVSRRTWRCRMRSLVPFATVGRSRSRWLQAAG